ncbi:response regulator [Methylobacillus arboreus]|uniref:response regulator n=1 Tax=Methylobacillus arboreus TaxID=755170 RepID=UPI001E3DB96C|nr:response regulator [Methylobacillus arboreus]MCB5189546.1 response regulator [Methylobacillus arboreus]
MDKQVRRALIVEDYQAAAETFKELLEMFGFQVDYVMAGADAARAVSLDDYDVVFMDLNLPDISGLALVKQLRALLPEKLPKFVAVSGFAKSDLGVEASELFDFYLEKPIDIATLEPILQSI